MPVSHASECCALAGALIPNDTDLRQVADITNLLEDLHYGRKHETAWACLVPKAECSRWISRSTLQNYIGWETH